MALSRCRGSRRSVRVRMDNRIPPMQSVEICAVTVLHRWVDQRGSIRLAGLVFGAIVLAGEAVEAVVSDN